MPKNAENFVQIFCYLRVLKNNTLKFSDLTIIENDNKMITKKMPIQNSL